MAHQEKERTPFLRFMKWDEHMADIRLSEAKRTSIIQLKAPARPDEIGYSALGSVVHDYILRGMDIGWNHNNQSRVRKHLAQGANLSPNAYVDFLFSNVMHSPLVHSIHDKWMPLTHNDSPASYAAVIEKFFLVTLRCLNGHWSGYKIPLNPVQEEAANILF
jgi:hypothetical protein